jgi:hypothetical protein
MRRSNRAGYKSASQLKLEAITNWKPLQIGRPLQIGKTTAPRVALMAGMAMVVQEIKAYSANC